MPRTVWRVLFFSVLIISAAHGQQSQDLEREIADLRALVQKLQSRVEELEARSPGPAASADAAPPASANQAVAAAPPAAATGSSSASASALPVPDQTATGSTGFLRGTTFNMLFDGYYGYNFNAPIGRVNRLRAYDVSSNSFSINQAAVVVENAADPEHGKHWGARLDLQWGQATQTLQGNSANEPRPDIYRALFQAYGTVVIPLGGHNVTVDFGKFASALGIEGNYTKDQINYSRSFWFDYLPFYHMGVRVNYKLNDRVALNYWVTNGTQQTEAFNAFKDQYAGITLQPAKTLTWNINYYLGQEHPDVVFYPYGVPTGVTGLPTQQGVPFQHISNAPAGRMHIFDTYATWQVTPAFTLAAEGDYVIQRLNSTSPPEHTAGGAGYIRYEFVKNFAAGFRAEYLADRGGLFSGTVQNLKETTFTLDYKFGKNFLTRAEWRRDFAGHPYFYTATDGVLSRDQNTATLGVVWWFGPKQGSW